MNRREMVGLGAAGLSLVASSGLAASRAPEQSVRTFMRMFATTSGEVCVATEGLIYGRAAGDLARPLCGYLSLLTVRAAEPQPGVFRTEQREATLYLDAKSGEVLKSFVNPYTQETVIPFGYVSPTNVYWFDKTGSYARDLPPVRTGEGHLIWNVTEDAISATEGRVNRFPAGISEAEFPRAFTGPERVSVDNLSYEAKVSDLNTSRAYIPALIRQLTDGPWQFWLMMGRTPGGVLWNGSGQKYRTIARSPARYRGLVEQVYPGFVADPWAFSQRDFGTLAQMRRLRAAGRI